MSAVTAPELVEPHGGSLRPRAGDRPDGVEGLERVTLAPRELADLDMLASGALSPLEGYMGTDDYRSVVEDMRLADGTLWALPVTLAVKEAPRGDVVALTDEAGTPLATLEVEGVFDYDRLAEAERCFGTTDSAHPGVARILNQGPRYLAGAVTVFDRPPPAFPELALDPADTRRVFAERGWRTVAGFQTRNPIHRAHEYVTKCALEITDGLLVHPLVGETKADDVPAAVRVECYRALLDGYYPDGRTVLAAFPAAMRYGGPREAVWHAICRKNYGCTHFIVGRDHAGVGNFYGTYEAQEIFAAIDPAELGIEPLRFEHSFWCRQCESMASTKSCPHPAEARVTLSGTAVREMLGRGERPPAEFSRPEVADILIRAYAG
jgi:sulfate adenylyltransferase